MALFLVVKICSRSEVVSYEVPGFEPVNPKPYHALEGLGFRVWGSAYC